MNIPVEIVSKKKVSETVNFSLLFLISAIFVHFDPIGIKITFPFFFLFFLLFSFRASRTTLRYFLLSFLMVLISIFNFFTIDNVIVGDFVKTFILLIFSLLFHIYFSTCYRIEKLKINSRYISFTLIVIFSFSLLQFIFFKYSGSTIFFNLFGKFSYANEYNLEGFGSYEMLRVTAFYLEPSYLGFVVINMYIYLYLLKRLRLWHLIILLIILYLAGSRGGYIFFALFMLYFSLISPSNSLMRRLVILIFTLSFLTFIFISTDSLSILAGENLVQENTSQYERIYLGYQLVERILLTYPMGIPLGHIETYFQKLVGINSSIFSFFFLAIAYFGFAGIALILSIFILILLKFTFRQFCFLSIYLLMYFNITGSLLAPDTYFWFSIFILLFRKSNAI